MAVNIDYYHDNRVMVVTYSSHVTAEDVMEVIVQYTHVSEGLSKHTHLISDGSAVTFLPPNLFKILSSASKLLRYSKDHTNILVVNNGFIVRIAGLISRMLGTRFCFVETVNQAWEMVNKELQHELASF